MFKDPSLINESDLLVTCPVFGATPTTSGSVLIDGVRHTVVRVERVPAAGVPVAWQIVVRRGSSLRRILPGTSGLFCAIMPQGAMPTLPIAA